MRVDEETEKMMRQSTGMAPMRTETGIRALCQGLASGRHQVMVMEGDIPQMRQFLFPLPAGAARKTGKAVPAIAQELLEEKAENYLKKLLSSVIGLPAHRIEPDAPMEKYGIDSIMVMQLTSRLEKVFGSLSKTLFFEYQTIRELNGYFL